MYLDCQVEIPNEPGKITRFKKGKSIYIRYSVGRIYNPEKKYNVPDHKTIGKLISEDSTMMIPNENFLRYFGDVPLPETRNTAHWCLTPLNFYKQINTYLQIAKTVIFSL